MVLTYLQSRILKFTLICWFVNLHDFIAKRRVEQKLAAARELHGPELFLSHTRWCPPSYKLAYNPNNYRYNPHKP